LLKLFKKGSMGQKKFTPEEIRQQEATKRKNGSLAPAKKGNKKTWDVDGNNVQEGYDEREYTPKEKADEKRSKGK
jgi:hypothetical protein